jgi:phosphate transport system ATP-binding protein
MTSPVMTENPGQPSARSYPTRAPDRSRSEAGGSPGVKITVRDLSFSYGAHRALKNISVDLRARQVTALIGPSGCGKSTFLRVLNRMNELLPQTTTTGSVRLDGTEIYAPRVDLVELRKRVGMVFQKPNPFPMSIFDNVLSGPRVHRRLSRAEQEEIAESALRGAALWDEVKEDLRKSALALPAASSSACASPARSRTSPKSS